MLAAVAEAMVDDLVAFAWAWDPDLIVYEPTTFAGPLASAVTGTPAVRHLYGLDLLCASREAVVDVLAPLCERHGLQPLDTLGALTIDPCPSNLQVPTDYMPLPVRYIPYNGWGGTPLWLLRRPGRPRVCVTWGTTIARLDEELFLTGRVAEAVSRLDVEVVAAISTEQRELLGKVPSHVIVAASLSLHPLLAACDLVVHQGGAGTVLTGLVCGLPQLVVPQLPDHAFHARRLAGCGAGEVLTREEATPDRIRHAAGKLLESPVHRESAQRLQRQMLRQPPPTRIVPVLEKLAGARSG